MLIQGIPEQAAVTTLAFIIAKVPIKWDRIFFIGTCLAFSAYTVRLCPIPFGIHTILVMFLLFMCLTKLSKRDVSLSFMASVLSYLILAIFECACLSLFLGVFNITPKIFLTNIVVRIGIGEIHVLLLFSAALLLNKSYIKRVT
ncbi:hypothetical protein SAMN02746098_03798 [Desulfosporosinus lacus DSM 15449]|uniref:Uncharacterized protein n=1 Tax=Desulfosporosinus lacus DSM 15449 TaxID=1121420 RepID=A0A1M5ZXG3_9FIRM|nr:hypothetical protein SAMN02746098_03798 [Desulfosporosinus lacus DSM 15449]